MNAGQLYINEYYAWSPYPKKGRFTHGARKVRLVNVETHKSRSDSNAKTFAVIIIDGTEQRMTVRAREIVAFWDDYHNEAEFLRKEEQDRVDERRRQQTKELVMSSIIANQLQEKTGMQLNGRIQYSPYAETITLPISEVVTWLGITDEFIDDKVTKVLENDATV